MKRNAQSQWKLFTGGKKEPLRNALWKITGSRFGGSEQMGNTAYFRPTARQLDNWQIKIFGKTLPNDGIIYKTLPDGQHIGIPFEGTGPGSDFYVFDVNRTKHRLFILANGYILDPDRVRPLATYCVGQLLDFSSVFVPVLPGIVAAEYDWVVSAKCVNHAWLPNSAGCVRYSNEQSLWRVAEPNAWWVSAGLKNAELNLSLRFSNGQQVKTVGKGKFSIYRPTVVMVETTVYGLPTIVWLENWHWLGIGYHGRIGLGFPNGSNMMTYRVRVISEKFWGEAKITQLCSLDFSGMSLNFCNSGLDNEDPYPGTYRPILAGPNPTGMVNLIQFEDGPQAPGYDSIRMNGTFVDYIMFKPDSPGSIYVPLGKVTWSTSTAVSYPSTTISPNVVTGPTGPDSADQFPEWDWVVLTP